MPKSALDAKSLKFLKFVLVLMILKDCEGEGEGEGERVPSLPQGETLAELVKALLCVQRFPELKDNKDELTDLITETRCQVCLFVCLFVCMYVCVFVCLFACHRLGILLQGFNWGEPEQALH